MAASLYSLGVLRWNQGDSEAAEPLLRRALAMLPWVVRPPTVDLDRQIRTIIAWSQTSRREGLLGLEKALEGEKEAFRAKGLALVVDGAEPHNVRRILEIEMERRMEDLNAVIDIRSAIGKGTTLLAKIPLEQDDLEGDLLKQRESHLKLAKEVYQYFIAGAGAISGIIFSGTLIMRGVVNDTSPIIISVLWVVLVSCLVGLRHG